MKEIVLTLGYKAIVDDEDYERLSIISWFAQFNRCRSRVYARGAFGPRTARAGRRRTIMMSHAILGTPPKGHCVIHLNGDSLDCRNQNLRFADDIQRQAMKSVSQNKKSSQYKGVFFENGKWRVRVSYFNIQSPGGFYRDEVEAAKAYDEKARLIFGEHFKGNFNQVGVN